MDKDPLITIGIPAFNASHYIGDCLNSILNQSYTDFEVIVTDDGSTDNTTQVVQRFRDNRIRLLTDQRNIGISARINQQVDMARGRFFCRMDADDVMFESRLKKQLDFMIAHPETDVIGSQAVVIDETNNIMGYRFCNPEFSRGSSLREILFIHPSIFGKTEWFRKNRYNNTYDGVEDYLLWNTSLANSRFSILTEPLIFYRDPGSSTPEKYLFRQKQIRQALKKLYRNTDISWFELISLIIKSMFKSIVFGSLSFFRLNSLLIKRRNQKVSLFERNIYSEELNKSLKPIH